VYVEYDSAIKALQQKNATLEDELAKRQRAAENMVAVHRENLAKQVECLHEELTAITNDMRAREDKLRSERDQALLRAVKANKKLEKI